MNDVQKEALAVLSQVWQLSPDVRLGQLFAHLGFLADVHVGRGLGYIEDDELLAIMYRHRAELLARAQETPNESLQPPGTWFPKLNGSARPGMNTSSIRLASEITVTPRSRNACSARSPADS